MAPKNIPAAGGLNSAVETVCGWALCAGVAYALTFMNLTGDGSLWSSFMGVAHDALPGSAEAVATRTYILPAKSVDSDTRAQDRMLMVPEQATEALIVKVQDRPSAALTDAPADLTKSAGRADWRVHISGQLPTFAVSGPAAQSSAAAARAGTAARATTASAKPAAAVVAAATVYRAPALDAEGTPRPGIVDDRSSGARAVESDGGLGNFKGPR